MSLERRDLKLSSTSNENLEAGWWNGFFKLISSCSFWNLMTKTKVEKKCLASFSVCEHPFLPSGVSKITARQTASAVTSKPNGSVELHAWRSAQILSCFWSSREFFWHGSVCCIASSISQVRFLRNTYTGKVSMFKASGQCTTVLVCQTKLVSDAAERKAA